jgi:beta-ribofuranosylaminobenzene 5'-phosphate synthase
MQMSLTCEQRYLLKTPSRLHFTLIDMNGEMGRIDGSIGLALEKPSIKIIFKKASELLIKTKSSKLNKFIHNEITYCSKLLNLQPNMEISVLESIPFHQGLGSGTQWRNALLNCFNIIFDCGYSPGQLNNLSGRGGTSGIGVYSTYRGGLIIDGGHNCNNKKLFHPSHFCKNVTIPPLLIRYEFPKDWGIVLLRPYNLHGLSGREEKIFMSSNTPIPQSEVTLITYIILMKLLPSLVEKDIEGFGRAINCLQNVGWKKCHWQRYGLKVMKEINSIFKKNRIFGCGLSSTGPTIFGFFDTKTIKEGEISENLSKTVINHKLFSGQIIITHANNTGMSLAHFIGG